MVSISKPLSAAKISSYYRSEYSSGSSNYFKQESKDGELRGEWVGNLATTLGLEAQQIREEHFDRLALGQHPITGVQLVKHRDSILTKEGKEVPHRAGYDFTFSAPKSVSLTALTDPRIIDVHTAAVRASLREMEQLIQAQKHVGNQSQPETTRKMVAAIFQHNSARPVDGYSAVQLHDHVIIFNLTEAKNGRARSLEPKELFRATGLITAVYQNHLERGLRALGYRIEEGKNHAPEVTGFTPEYLASESKRSKQIEEKAEELGLTGQAAKSNIAHQTREAKQKIGPEEIRAAHMANAAAHGNQQARIMEEAVKREGVSRETPGVARQAVNFAREHLSENNSVFDHHQVVAQALWYARGRVGLEAIKSEIETQRATGEFIPVQHVRAYAPMARYTTPALIENERKVIEAVVLSPAQTPINRMTDEVLAGRFPALNEWQRKVVIQALASERQISGINGAAGVGKSFSLGVLRELAEESGWKVYGLAPTSGAARALKESGVENSETLQRYLMAAKNTGQEVKRLFFVDEGSLVSGRQMRRFIQSLRTTDKVILCGDWRQHQSVEAGRIFEQLQLAGMQTARINKLVRQKDPGLKEVIQAMAQGKIAEGVALLEKQGRVTEVSHRGERFAVIAKAYAADPKGTLIVSPDNASRSEINSTVRKEMKRTGQIGADVYKASILIPRQNITGARRRVASAYQIGDVVLYRAGSKQTGIKKQEYGNVIAVDRDANRITVKLDGGKEVTYNPERLKGVSVYTQETRQFAVGDRLQMTTPVRKLGLSNRDTGTITSIDTQGNVRVQMDKGQSRGFSLGAQRHVEHGYVSTSHAAQGSTVNRVLVHVDTGDSKLRNLVNQTLAYVALSRPKYEAHVFTDNRGDLAKRLSHKEENSMALSPKEVKRYKGMAA